MLKFIENHGTALRFGEELGLLLGCDAVQVAVDNEHGKDSRPVSHTGF
jgi:hypothetical protein